MNRVFRYCVRRTGNVAEAEDLTSAIFLRTLERLPSYQGGTFPAWLFAIARTVVIDRYRHVPWIDNGVTEEPADPDAEPEELALAGEAAIEVWRLLAHLLPDQLAVIELRLSGLSGVEIAKAMGRSVAAVKMLQMRAMKAFRAVSAAEWSERGGDP